MSIFHATEGIKIGPDIELDPGDDRLPIFDFDEWVENSGIGEMTALETRTLTFTGFPTLRMGASVFAKPMNPDIGNQNKLLILHTWVHEDGIVKVIVKNLENSTVDFGSDEWAFGGWNTATPI